MTKFLTLKHWQIFGLVLGLQFVFQSFIVGTFITSTNPLSSLYFLPVTVNLINGFLFSWYFSIGTYLHKRLPSQVHMNLKRFKTFLIFPFVYLLLFSAYIVGMFFNVSNGEEINPSNYILVIPLHLFSLFCIFYCLHFIAKALKSVEYQRPVTLNEFTGELLLLWIYPIGIWFIQPRINKLSDTTMKYENQLLETNI